MQKPSAWHELHIVQRWLAEQLSVTELLSSVLGAPQVLFHWSSRPPWGPGATIASSRVKMRKLTSREVK